MRCFKCGGEIFKRRFLCPKCGAPNFVERPYVSVFLTIFPFVLILSIFLGMYLIAGDEGDMAGFIERGIWIAGFMLFLACVFALWTHISLSRIRRDIPRLHLECIKKVNLKSQPMHIEDQRAKGE